MATYSSLSQMTDAMREQITNSDAQAIKDKDFGESKIFLKNLNLSEKKSLIL